MILSIENGIKHMLAIFMVTHRARSEGAPADLRVLGEFGFSQSRKSCIFGRNDGYPPTRN